jgi:D-alanine-D-alanine ligase
MMIHGTPGEDGKLQGYFDMIGLPYTGCNQLASTVTFNKWACNTMLKQLGFKCADSVLLRKGDKWTTEDIIAAVKLPCFVKPNDGGSSFGVTKVKTAEELPESIKLAFAEGSEVLIESMIAGTEITCGVLRMHGKTSALPVTEIIPEGEFFDYAAKYEGKSSEITPARLNPEVYSKVQHTAQEIYDQLGLGGVVRIDMMIQEGVPLVIEINTVPGMSAASIIPQQAEKAGILLKDLISALIFKQ